MFDGSAEMVDTLASVADADTAALDADGLLEQLSKIQQLESGLAARKAETMVAFHHVLAGTSADLGHDSPRPGDRPAGPAERRWSGDVLRSVSDEIGLAMGAHRKTAARWLNRAAVLVERFPVTLQLLRAGGLPAAAAQHVAHELAVIVDDELRAAVEQIVLAWGRRYGWAKIKKIANREAQKVLAEYESLLHAHRQLERTTYTVSHDGGMADLVVSTSAIDITAIMAALTTRARDLQRAGDPRNLDQLRTDLAVDRLLGHDQTAAATSAEHTTNAEPRPAPAPAPGHASTAHLRPEPAPEPSNDAWARPEHPAGGQPATGNQFAHAETAPDVPATSDCDTTSGPVTTAHPETAPGPVAASGAMTASGPVTASGAMTTPGPVTTSDAEVPSDFETASGAEADAAADAWTVPAAETVPSAAVGGRGAGSGPGGSVPGSLPESGLNPAVGVQVVIHCTYAEAEALATGAICTGGELEGYGTLPQDALAMAFNRAKFRYRLTDRSPKSDPTRYTPSPGLDQHVRDRDQRCRFPGCNARVEYCDLDHRVPFPDGETDADNLEAFCRHHHRLKHHGDWQVFATDTGTLIFISPTGRAYLDPPTMPDTGRGTPSVESRTDAA
jgi:hypothetical protein